MRQREESYKTIGYIIQFSGESASLEEAKQLGAVNV